MKVLIADDTPTSLLLACKLIDSIGHEHVAARDGREAVHLFERERPDLVLLDVDMPRLSGYEAARRIKRYCEEQNDWIPIVFLNNQICDEDVAHGIEAGGDDYLTKPVSRMLLTAKLNAMQRVTRVRQRLAVANRALERLSRTDTLTGAANRRFFDETLEREWHVASLHDLPLSLVLCDIDHFKGFNQHYGHQAGDDCLHGVARALALPVRCAGDLLARYDGEEFAAVLTTTGAAGAMVLAEQMRATVQALSIPHERSETAPVVTISVGIATLAPADTPERGPNTLIVEADRALFAAKKRGGNRAQRMLSTAAGVPVARCEPSRVT